ncbi:MAG: hypothetical protein IJW28_04540, partial [Clostridia bacterium]|nr:hypothetical protein [Clostridia bacterium]
MKKKIVGLMLGLGLMTTAPVALTGCDDTPPPITIDQMFVRCNFGEMIIQGNNVTLKYSEQIANPENMFYVMGLTSDRTEVFLTNSANTTAGQDGQTQEITYYIDTNISSGIVAVGTYYYNITASNGMTLNLNITVVPGVYDISSFHWNNTDNLIYTGEEQEITLDEWNLPNGVSVTYTGNKATDAGTYTATAHFNCTDPNYEPIPD